MKKHLIYTFLLMMAVASMDAERTIHVSNPETWSNSSLSAYGGETVVFDCPMYICNNTSYGGTGYRVGPRRVYSPTNQAIPGSAEYQTQIQRNNTATIGINGIPTNGTIRRDGEIIHNLRVTLNPGGLTATYVSGTFAGNSRQDLINEANAGFPDLYDHQDTTVNVIVCGLNCEYYLTTTFGTGFGPDDAAEHVKQRTKISDAMSAIGADVFGLVEIQKGNGALAEIAADLTEKTGHPYRYVDSRTAVSGSYTQSGFVYRSDRVTPIGTIQKVSDTGSSFRDRIVMIRFQVQKNGGTFIYSINHYKAKSGTATGQDADKGDGQGSYNYTRVQQANATINKYQTLSASWKEEDILVMGDLNAYGMEDPIRTFTDQGFIDLHRAFHADSSYSYVYSGQAGYLDHAIANPTMFRQVRGMKAYHINSDEHDTYTYDTSSDLTRFRCSDHDPVLVALAVEPENRGSGIEELFDRIVPTYYRIYTLRGELIHEGAEMELPDAPGIYIVVKYGQDGKHNQARMVANRKYEVR